MFIFFAGLPDADYRNDNADYGHHDTDDTYNSIHNQICTFHFYFPLRITSKMPEVLRTYSFGRKANRYPFGNALYIV